MAKTKEKKVLTEEEQLVSGQVPVEGMKSEEKMKIIEAAMSLIDKKFGEGSIMRLGSKKKLKVDVISTGALSLDAALGVGGVPRGRVIEIYGPEASGKNNVGIKYCCRSTTLRWKKQLT